jgi:hypothetical protein
MKHSESIAAIAEAIAAAQAEYVTVPKTKTAKVKTKAGYEYTYNYADLADILAMALPRLSKQGIAFSQPHILIDGKLRVVTYLLHKTGEWMHSDGIEISEEGDPQQFGAESTYFRRYDGASFIGVAPDEDTDAQQAGPRTKRTTPAQAEAQARPTTTQQSSQQAQQRQQTAKPAAQPQVGQLKFIPPNGLTTVIKGVKDVAAQAATEDRKAIRPYVVVTFLGQHNGCNFASCFDAKLWPLLKDSIGLECHFQIKEADKNSKHFINIEDVIYADGVEYVGGVPVTPQGQSAQGATVEDSDMPF